MKEERIIVIGGAGFIGRNLISKLAKEDYPIASVDRLDLNIEGVDHHKLDLSDQESLKQTLSKYPNATLINLASISDVSLCRDNPELAREVNVTSFDRVLKLCSEFGIKRVLFPSSALVYSLDNKMPVSEEAEVIADGVYQETKLAAEFLLESWCSNNDNSGISFRLAQVYGPNQGGVTLIGDTLSQLPKIANKTLDKLVLNNISAIRDFIYIDDVVNAFITCLDSKPGYEVYNLSSGEGHSVRSIAETLCQIASHQANIEGRKNIASELVLDSAKLQKMYAWAPKVSLSEGLKITYESALGDK